MLHHPKDEKLYFTFKVAGTNKNEGGFLWSDGSGSMEEVVREPDNEYDKNAIALYVAGLKGGYVPRGLAKEIAPLIDAGYEARIVETQGGFGYRKRLVATDEDDYYYEEDESDIYNWGRVTIVLTPPNSSCLDGRSGHVWSKEEIDYLASHRDASAEAVSSVLGLAPDVVERKRIRMRLRGKL